MKRRKAKNSNSRNPSSREGGKDARGGTFKLGFLGIGRMAEILLRAVLKSKLIRPHEVLVSRNSETALSKLARELKVRTTTDNTELAERCEQIWIGVKPFQAAEVLREIRPHLREGQILLSMMAGISTKFLKSLSGGKASLVRIMPNTPCLVGEGLIGVYSPKKDDGRVRLAVLPLLSRAGGLAICKRESELDAITGLSGSGVAFVYDLAQGMIDGGVQSGLSLKQASEIALKTLLGAARMLQETGTAPDQLVSQVVSKGGTTEAGLKVLAEAGARDRLARAVLRASERAGEIREENDACIS